MGEAKDDRGALEGGLGNGVKLLPPTLVGSYPQPDWLIDRRSLLQQMPPRGRARQCGASSLSISKPHRTGIRAALHVVPPERLVVLPDCGLKYLPRDVAYGKMRAMAEGAAIVRREYTI